MEIGKLNQRITFLENRTKVDEIGNHTAQWEEISSCWADVYITNSSENMEGGVTSEKQTIRFVIRQTFDRLRINSTTHKILFRGQIYNIISVKPNYEKRDYITISAEIHKAGEDDEQY